MKEKNFSNIYKFLELLIIPTLFLMIDIYGKYFGYILINPNPYFLFSIFVAVRYGINYSVLTSSLSIFYTFLSLYIQLDNEYLRVFTSWEVLKVPLFIFLFSFVIGFFRDMHVQKINYQSEQISLLKERIKTLEEEIRKFKNVTDDLEHKLVLERQGVSLLVEKLKDIEYNSAEDIFNEAIDLISEFISAKTVSIYTLSKNNFLRMKVRKGPQFLPNSFSSDKSVVISMAKEFGSANVNVLYLTEMEYDFEYEPAMAVAIKSENVILGFIMVEIIDPEKINKNTETYMKILADWLSTLLLASKELSGNEKEVLVYPIDEFERILVKIEERKERFKIPYSVIKLKVSDENSLVKIQSFIRDTDFAFFDENNKKVNIILTSCSKDGLEKALKRMSGEKDFSILEAYTKE